MHRERLRIAIGGLGLLFVTGCVTINIYFPAAAAEKAADRIIDEVWQAQQGASPPKPAAKPESAPAQPGN